MTDTEGSCPTRVDELAKAGEALQATIDVLSIAQDPDDVVPKVLGIVGATFGTSSCAWYENDPTGLVTLRYWLFEGQIRAPEEMIRLDPVKFGLVATLAAGFRVPESYLGIPSDQPGTTIIDHHSGTSITEFDQFAIDTGWDLELNVGVARQGRRGFTLCIYRRHSQPYTPAEIALAEALAKQLALVMEYGRLAQDIRQVAILREKEDAAERRVAELVRANEALRRGLSRFSNPEGSVDDLLNHVLVEISAMTGARASTVMVHLPESDALQTRALWSGGRITTPVEPGQSLWNTLIPLGEVPLWSEMLKGSTVTSELPDRPNGLWMPSVAWHLEQGNRFVICLPLAAGDAVIGLIGLAFPTALELGPEVLEYVRALTNQAALAIQLTRLSEASEAAAVAREREKAARNRAAELSRTNQVLKQVLDVVAIEPNLDKVLGHLLCSITQQLGSRSSALWLLNGSSGRFTVSLSYSDGKIIDHHEPSDSRDKEGWGKKRDLTFKDHVRERRPVVYQTDEMRDTYPEAYQFFRSLGVETSLGIPLLIGSEIIGSITVRFESRRTLTPEELEVAQAMAHQATMAIQLTRLAERAGMAALADERARLARDIHDTLAQGFTGILMQLGAASQIAGNDRSAISSHLEAIGNLARASLVEARRSVRGLRQLVLPAGSLTRNLEQLIDRMRYQTKVSIGLQFEGRTIKLPPMVQNELLRIAQEALNNAIHHAQCDEIRVSLEFQRNQAVRLSIKDNGVGFDPAQPSRAGSFGLIGMQERAEAIRAALTIISEPGRGTQIIVRYELEAG